MADLIRQGVDCRHGSRLLAGADGPGKIGGSRDNRLSYFFLGLFLFLPRREVNHEAKQLFDSRWMRMW